jgi:Helicase associated domain
VPLNHVDPKLGLWVKEQRRHYALLRKNQPSHMTEERAMKLDDLGFCWDTNEATWLERLRELKAYKDEFGHCLVPTYWDDNPKLSTWVHHQRRQYKKYMEGRPCHITKSRIALLNDVGISWPIVKKKRPKSASDSESSDSSDDDDDSSDEEEDARDDAEQDDDKSAASSRKSNAIAADDSD